VGGTTPELVLNSGFNGADWNDPSVVRVGNQYWMYASSNLGFAGPPSPVQIYRWVSSDGTTWALNPSSPVLTEGALGAWDHGGAETPAVVFFNGAWHMFYTGYPDAWPTNSPFNFRIGHAVSNDGVTWIKDATYVAGPSEPAATFYQYIVAEPGPAVMDNTLYLYFSAVGVDVELAAGLQVVGVITTTDGASWTQPALAMKPDQTVYPRTSNWVGYSTPNATVIAGRMHLFVDVANDHGDNTWTQEAIHHALSPDGLTGWLQDPAPLRRKADFIWTQRELRSPAVLLDGTLLRLYFAGDDVLANGLWGIGQMTCSLVP